jgi:hypothetical protein
MSGFYPVDPRIEQRAAMMQLMAKQGGHPMIGGVDPRIAAMIDPRTAAMDPRIQMATTMQQQGGMRAGMLGPDDDNEEEMLMAMMRGGG